MSEVMTEMSNIAAEVAEVLIEVTEVSNGSDVRSDRNK